MTRMKFFAILLSVCTIPFINGARAENIVSQRTEGVKVVVLDPGHGGKFPGAVWGGVKEKDLSLSVALKLGALIEEGMPGVKVVYTRKTDKQLGDELIDDLQARADIANKSKGDLFLSIHVNASKDRSARGVETLVMGETPKEQQYNEAALISSNREEYIELVDDAEGTAAMKRAYVQNLQFTYGTYSMAFARSIQDSYRTHGRHMRKVGIKTKLLRVLFATNMPGALTEIGFMSNAQEMAYLKTEKGQREVARSLYEAVKSYADRVEAIRRAEEDAERQDAAAASDRTDEPDAGTAPASGAAAAKAAEAVEAVEAVEAAEAAGAAGAERKTFYAVQLLASAEPVAARSAEFKSYRGQAKCYRGQGRLPYKYCVGEFPTAAAAQRKLKEVRKHFPDAFVVCCRGGEIVSKK